MIEKLFWFLVTIAILIPIHEYGHYGVARACGVKVLRFSIGFGRVLFSRRFGPDGTEFALSMVPLGGYVKWIDENDPGVDPVDLPRAFGRRPLYQRASIVAAGPAANLLLAVLLFGFVQWWGLEQFAPVASTPVAGSLMARAGLRSGDRLVAASVGADDNEREDWQDVRSFDDVYDTLTRALMDREPVRLRVTHPGEPGQRTLNLPLDSLDPEQAGVYDRIGLGAPFAPPRIGEILAGGAASQAGLRSGDLVLRVDGQPVADAQALRGFIVATLQAGAPRAMQWEVSRDGRPLALTLTPRIEIVEGERVPRVGVGFTPGERMSVRAEPLEALRLGAVQAWRQASGSLHMFGLMLTGQASLHNLGGSITIAEVATSSAHQGLAPFLVFLATISVGLGVLNLLPIPMLDGGSLLYYLFEGATGRPVPELWQARLQRGGFVILLLLMSLALSNDVARHLGLQ